MTEKQFRECSGAPHQGMGPGEVDYSEDCSTYGEVKIRVTSKYIEEAKKLGIDKECLDDRGIDESGLDACSRHAGELVDPEDDELKGLWEVVE